MKATFAVAALSLATAASAQFSNLPSCALNCFLGPLRSDGCSQLTDFECHCSKDSLIPKVQPCVQSRCSSSQQEEVITAVESLCKQYGVTLSISTPGATMTTSSSSSETSSLTGPVLTHPITTGFPSSTGHNNGSVSITKPTLTSHTTQTTGGSGGAGGSSSGSGSGTSTNSPDFAPTAGFGNYLAFAAGAAALAL